MLDVIFPIDWLFIFIYLPFFAIPSTTLIPQLRHSLSAFNNAFLPIKLSFFKSTKRPSPTEKGLVSSEKSCPADKSPASILLPLNDGVAVIIIPIFFPFSRIRLPNFSALFSGLKYISHPSSFVNPVRLIITFSPAIVISTQSKYFHVFAMGSSINWSRSSIDLGPWIWLTNTFGSFISTSSPSEFALYHESMSPSAWANQ